MQLKLYYSTKVEPFQDPRNDGFEAAFSLLRQLEKKGIKYEVIHMSQLTIEEPAVKGVIDETGLDIKDGRVKFLGR